MTREEKIKFITYRFKQRDPEYPIERFAKMADSTIDQIYAVESDSERKEIEEQALSAF